MDPVRPGSSRPSLASGNVEEGATAVADPRSVPASPARVCPASAADTDSSAQLAVRSLLEAYSRTGLPPKLEPSSTATPRTDNNAARTSSRSGEGAYADAGVTSSGDGVFAGVAALKQHDALSGVDVEVFTASAQFGAQTELQAGLVRAGVGGSGRGLDANVSAEFLTARANLGIYTDDDCEGANVGAMLTGAGAELTVSRSGWSGTVGLSTSVGFAVSSGERNIDGDEVPERCFKGSLGPLTLGVCTEL